MTYFNQNEPQSNSNTTKIRTQIDDKFKWNLNDIYENEEHWEKDFKFIEDSIPKYEKFKGNLSESAINLFQCVKLDEYNSIKLERLNLYSFLSKDLDLNNTHFQEMRGKITNLYSKLSEASAFIIPEILEIDKNKINQFLKEDDKFKVYSHYFDNLFRTKEHSLPKEQEELLAMVSPALQTASNTFSLLKNADIQFPSIENEKGIETEISEGMFYSGLYSTDRDYRKRLYKNYYKPYIDYKNTYSSLFNGNLKAHIFNAKARKYGSTRESALKPNNIPLEVYDNLVKTASENVSSLHRWAEIRKKVLNIDEIHPYDFYVTLFPESKKTYDYSSGVKIVKESLKCMGDEYLEILNKAFNNRWIDVYETKGKRSGAYSSGVTYGVHPYVLLNWTNTYNDISTLTHEMGHNMHSYFTGKKQPYVYAGYPIFLAEVASITNENILHDYMMSTAETKEEKLSLIETAINKIVTTFFRQTQFAEYEQLVYQKTEAGESLTPDSLSQLYSDLYKKYYGDSVIMDEEESFTWARVPHFYYRFYVYQYATGLAASELLAKMVKEEGMAGAGKIMRFLKAGNSDYPIEILKLAGVDMTSKEPIQAVVTKMNDLMDQLEELLNS